MSARRAYGFVYGRLVAPLDEERRTEVDAILGDPAAKAEVERRRQDAVAFMGVEIG